MSIISFIKNPLEGYVKNLAKEEKTPVYVYPLLYGLIFGISFTISKFGVANINTLFDHLPFILFSRTLITLISCYVYAWIILVISWFFKGVSNINLTFSLVSYSLLPMIGGALLFLLLKLILVTVDISVYSLQLVNIFIFYFQYIFVLWSIYILTVGNAMINDFSKLKSFVASAGIVIVIIAIIIFD